MMAIKTVIEKETGKVLFAFDESLPVDIQENQEVIPELLTEGFANPYFDFTTRSFYDKIE